MCFALTFFFLFLLNRKVQKQDESLTQIEGSLNKHLQIQKDTLSTSADKDMTIARLQSEIKKSHDKLEEQQREVSGT